jgi:hypothetical protein
MSTHCLIGVVHGETIKTIYCRFDGYPHGVGEMLLEHYNSAKANHLISLGDISYLEKEIEPPAGVEHSFDNPADGVTVFYGRDRNEPNAGWNIFLHEPSFNHYRNCLLSRGNDFKHVYLIKNDMWYYLPSGTKLSNAKLLSEVI